MAAFHAELKEQFGLEIVGPRADAARIPGIDTPLGEGDSWRFGDLEMRVMDTPGHTRGHITLYFPEAGALFPGTAPLLCSIFARPPPGPSLGSCADSLKSPRPSILRLAGELTNVRVSGRGNARALHCALRVEM